MAGMAIAIDVRHAVLEAVRHNPRRPSSLLSDLTREGLNDSEVRQAISELLRISAIQLTPDRYLKIAEKQIA